MTTPGPEIGSAPISIDESTFPWNRAVGFIEKDAAGASSGFQLWAKRISYIENRRRRLNGGRATCFQALERLTGLYTKVLFMETDSAWSAMIINDISGRGAREHVGRLAAFLGVRSIFARVAKKAQWRDHAGHVNGNYDAAIFSVYGPEDRPGTLNLLRHIQASKEGNGRWVFQSIGELLSFENEETYKKRNIKDRLNSSIITRYLSEYGIRFLDITFYMPSSKSTAYLVG